MTEKIGSLTAAAVLRERTPAAFRVSATHCLICHLQTMVGIVQSSTNFSCSSSSSFAGNVLPLTLACLLSAVCLATDAPLQHTQPPNTPYRTMAAANQERTFIMVKPDGVQRGLVGEIIKRFEVKGFKLVALKFQQASEELLKKHYADLAGRPFFPSLINYMQMGPVVPMVWEGLGVVKTGRVMLGETNPADSKPGSIRGDFCIQTGRNIIHGSDSVESANKEIALWFKPEELTKYKPAQYEWVYEN